MDFKNYFAIKLWKQMPCSFNFQTVCDICPVAGGLLENISLQPNYFKKKTQSDKLVIKNYLFPILKFLQTDKKYLYPITTNTE